MYDSDVFRRAVSRLEADIKAHNDEKQALRQEIYRKSPQIAQTDSDMRRLAIQLCKAPFDKRISAAALDEQVNVLRRRRAELLQTGGWDPFVLEDEPLCRVCGDTGWLKDGMCTCLKRRCVAEQMKELSNTMSLGNQSFQSFRLDVYSDEPDEKLGISPRQNMEKNLNICTAYAHHFGRSGDKNLLFSGSTGLGKTFLSACIARVVSEQEHSVVYDTAVNILRRFEQEKFRDDPDARDETRRYQGCDLLIIDDLGCEMLSAFVTSALYDLINSRLVEGRSTIISTNLSPRELQKRYSPQICSRLLGEYRVMPFFGADIRLSNKYGR